MANQSKSKKPESVIDHGSENAAAAIVALGIFIFFGWMCTSTGGGSTTTTTTAAETTREPSDFDAYYMSRKFITDQLRAPATAKFPSSYSDAVTVMKDGDRFVVAAYVDAQNGFGALIRSHYLCEMTHLGNDRWRRGECGLLE